MRILWWDFLFIERTTSAIEKYLIYMFEKKESSPMGSRKEQEKVLPWDLLICELFYPTTKDIIQSNIFLQRFPVKMLQCF